MLVMMMTHKINNNICKISKIMTHKSDQLSNPLPFSSFSHFPFPTPTPRPILNRYYT